MGASVCYDVSYRKSNSLLYNLSYQKTKLLCQFECEVKCSIAFCIPTLEKWWIESGIRCITDDFFDNSALLWPNTLTSDHKIYCFNSHCFLCYSLYYDNMPILGVPPCCFHSFYNANSRKGRLNNELYPPSPRKLKVDRQPLSLYPIKLKYFK